MEETKFLDIQVLINYFFEIRSTYIFKIFFRPSFRRKVLGSLVLKYFVIWQILGNIKFINKFF